MNAHPPRLAHREGREPAARREPDRRQDRARVGAPGRDRPAAAAALAALAAGLVCVAVAGVGGGGAGAQEHQQLEVAEAAPAVAPRPDTRAAAPDRLQVEEGVLVGGEPQPAAPPVPLRSAERGRPARPPGTGLPPPPPGPGVPVPGARYGWPLMPVPAVLAPFREPAHVYGPGHRGADLAGQPGQPVFAARAGSVVFAGPVGGRSVVSVQHDDALRTTYEPVRPLVTAGVLVRAGDVIGLLEPGHPGCAPAVCLHWGLRRDRTAYLDPLVLLRPPRVRLLPVPDPWPLAPRP